MLLAGLVHFFQIDLPLSHLILVGKSPSFPSHMFPVSQGFTLGPILFSTYVVPFERLVDECGACYHQYADDTQLYMHLISEFDTLVDFCHCVPIALHSVITP